MYYNVDGDRVRGRRIISIFPLHNIVRAAAATATTAKAALG